LIRSTFQETEESTKKAFNFKNANLEKLDIPEIPKLSQNNLGESFDQSLDSMIDDDIVAFKKKTSELKAITERKKMI